MEDRSLSVSSLPQGPEGKVKELVAQCLSVRTPATHSTSSPPERARPSAVTRWEGPGSMYCPPQQLRPTVARAGSPLGCSPQSGGLRGPRKVHFTARESAHKRRDTVPVEGRMAVSAETRSGGFLEEETPPPQRPEGGGQVGPGQGGGFRGLGEGGQPRPPASQQWQLGGLQQVSELTPNVGHPQGRSPSSPPSAQGSKAGAPDSLEQAAHRVGWCRESPRAQETQRMAGQLAGIQKVRGG